MNLAFFLSLIVLRFNQYVQGSNGRSHFMFVTNLAPCSGVRLHLWPEKRNSTSGLPVCIRILEVTSRMMRIPSGPAPRQVLNVAFMTMLLLRLVALAHLLADAICMLLFVDTLYLIRLNLEARQSKLLRLLYFTWDLRICADSDSWPSQLHLVWYSFSSMFLLQMDLFSFF